MVVNGTTRPFWEITPELISPTSDVIDLKGKDALEFKWLIRNPVFIDYTDLRLYKTYNTYANNLIFKTRIPSGATNTYSIKADTFQSGQVYTCVLKTVSLGGEKSDFVYTSFKVIK